jgi:hypothetical protein
MVSLIQPAPRGAPSNTKEDHERRDPLEISGDRAAACRHIAEEGTGFARQNSSRVSKPRNLVVAEAPAVHATLELPQSSLGLVQVGLGRRWSYAASPSMKTASRPPTPSPSARADATARAELGSEQAHQSTPRPVLRELRKTVFGGRPSGRAGGEQPASASVRRRSRPARRPERAARRHHRHLRLASATAGLEIAHLHQESPAAGRQDLIDRPGGSAPFATIARVTAAVAPRTGCGSR